MRTGRIELLKRLITKEQLEDSLQVQVGAFLFVVQFKKGNNVVMERVTDSTKISLIDAICLFIEFCRRRGIEYLTIESRDKSDIYYKIASKYFSSDEFFMDDSVLRVRLLRDVNV